MTEIYLVAGATGGLGQEIVNRLLLKNQHVRAFVRDVTKGRALLGENLEVIEGDIRRIDTVNEAMQGVDTVICATAPRSDGRPNSIEEIDYEGVRNLANVAAHVGVKRFILISSVAATKGQVPAAAASDALDWKQKGEAALRASGVDYVIVRPGELSDAPSGQSALMINQGETTHGSVSRADVAELVLHLLPRKTLCNVTFCVTTEPGAAPQTEADWDQLLEGLERDR